MSIHEWDCPRCQQPGEYLEVDTCEYYACAKCKVYWFVGNTFMLSQSGGAEPLEVDLERWLQNGRRLNSLQRVDPVEGALEGDGRPYLSPKSNCYSARVPANMRGQRS